MGLMDVLGQYARQPYQHPPHVHDDFEQVARELPPEELEEGLVEAFDADETPPFEEMVGQLYDRSDEDTRAGLLREIFGGALPGGATRLPTREVEAAAAEARRNNPSILQRVGRYYAQHPQLVQVLGQAALGILMRNVARRRRF